jgi:hypothetical protein
MRVGRPRAPEIPPTPSPFGFPAAARASGVGHTPLPLVCTKADDASSAMSSRSPSAAVARREGG